MKNVVVWSGGFDSSFMVSYLIENETITDECNLISIETTLTGPTKSSREREAREKIYEAFKKNYSHINFTLTTIKMHDEADAPIGISTNGLSQPILWVANVLPYVSSNTCIYFGYIAGDDAVGYKHLNQQIIDDFLHYRNTENVKIVYPLNIHHKYDVMYTLLKNRDTNDVYDSILKYATTCECKDENDWCGICKPCRSMIMTLIEGVTSPELSNEKFKYNAHRFLKEKFSDIWLEIAFSNIRRLFKGDDNNHEVERQN